MKWFKRSKHYLLLTPALLIAISLTGFGLVMAFLESIQYKETPSFRLYKELLTDAQFIDSFFYSVRITLISTLVSILIGLGAVKVSYPLLKKFVPRLIAWLPMLFPHFIWGYMVYLLLSQTGFFSSVLSMIGLINGSNDFPIIMKDSYGLGIILTYIGKEVPFVILMLQPVYEQLSYNQKELVYTLGGSRWAVFQHVEWPYVFPVIIEIFFILFSFILSSYEVPALLGVTYPKMLSVLSYDWFYGSDWTQQPYAFALMTLTTITILLIVLIVLFLTKKHRRHLSQTEGSNNVIPKIRKSSAIIFVLLCFTTILPILLLIVTSFVKTWNYGELIPTEFSLRAWELLLSHETQIAQAIFTSIGIGLCVVLLNIVIGTPAAKIMAFYEFKGKTTIASILLAPILIPTLLVAMGLHLSFIRLGLANTIIGVVIVHLLPTLPYTIKILRAAFERIGKKQEEIAISLGAKTFKSFYSIYLPQLLPSYRSTVFLVTVISLGQYLLTALIGGGNVTTLAILYFPFFQSADDAMIASFSLLFIFVPIVIWFIIELFLKLTTKRTRW
ncbi:ABC transporter permease subunit [Metabacillus litoralis]|uniref:ABC transporter permease subunit n=1 Tax=Metabacillus litoralis TaxID=152268 RepID=A0A5C6W928_9BACI|nr:ABC transporter permease subunit [Metabacillus litoralis]TXC92950.1 ABC transporter permease subunit [Metabacillus litoralis]